MSTAELEYRLLYSMVVAGKSAKFAEDAMGRFVGKHPTESPFEYIRRVGSGRLSTRLRAARTGCYRKLWHGFYEAANSGLDLATCTPSQLERIHGVGPKTSRFFILWTRPNAEHAALDTHVLKWLRYLGHKAPMSTPSGEKYATLEKIVLAEAKARGMTARELDSAIWDYGSENADSAKNGIWPERLQRRHSVTD